MSDPRYREQLAHDQIKALADARSIVDAVHAEHRTDLTGEENASYERASNAAKDLRERLDEWDRREVTERAAATARASVESIVRPQIENRDSGDQDPIRRFFEDGRATRSNGSLEIGFTGHRLHSPGAMPKVETRALGEGTGAGSLVLPTIVASQLYTVLADTGAIWRLSPQVMSTTDGRPTWWPKVSTIGTSTATVEAGTLTQSDPGLGVTKTNPIKYANMTLLSNELLVDSAVDIAQLVMNHMGESMAKGYGPAFATGAGGAGTVTGYMTGGSVVATGAGTITPAAVITLQSKINQRYRAANAMFATTDGVLAYLRSYRATGGTDGPWLVQQPSAPGFPETIFGCPVVIDNYINTSGSGVKEIAFGSFERGYIVHEAGLRFESSYDYAFNTDQTAYRQILRLDGEVQDTAAYGVYQRSS